MNRKQFLTALGLNVLAAGAIKISSLAAPFKDLPDLEQLMPVLFIGHGNPMNAIEDNHFSRAWKAISSGISKPKAIMCISAHWETSGTYVALTEKPETIHDFYGFPKQLHDFIYDCPGSPAIAKEIISTVNYAKVKEDPNWGLDHGTWSILAKMYPDADIPVLQLSIDRKQPMQFHFELAKQLAFLRKKGVLIIGSGNIVHNLRLANFTPDASPYDWAVEFDENIKELILKEDFNSIINYEKLGKAALLSVPTPDHYIPLLYSLGLKNTGDNISFPVAGMAFGSGSMRSVTIG